MGAALSRAAGLAIFMFLDDLAWAEGVVVIPCDETRTAGPRPRRRTFKGSQWKEGFLAFCDRIGHQSQIGLSARLIGSQGSALPIVQLSQAIRYEWLSDVLARESIVPHFQSLVSLQDRSTIGFEAVARAETAGKLVSGGELAEAARALNAVPRFDEVACRAAIRGGGNLLQGDERLFVNIQPTSLTGSGSGLQTTWDALRDSGVDPAKVVLEIVETEPLPALPEMASMRRDIRNMGALFALDDVGSGYGAMTNIVALEPDYVKIDRALVAHRDSPGCQELVEGMVKFAHGAGARVVIEGIEGEADWEFAVAVGADIGQGFWIGRPEAEMHRSWGAAAAAGTNHGRAA